MARYSYMFEGIRKVVRKIRRSKDQLDKSKVVELAMELMTALNDLEAKLASKNEYAETLVRDVRSNILWFVELSRGAVPHPDEVVEIADDICEAVTAAEIKVSKRGAIVNIASVLMKTADDIEAQDGIDPDKRKQINAAVKVINSDLMDRFGGLRIGPNDLLPHPDLGRSESVV